MYERLEHEHRDHRVGRVRVEQRVEILGVLLNGDAQDAVLGAGRGAASGASTAGLGAAGKQSRERRSRNKTSNQTLILHVNGTALFSSAARRRPLAPSIFQAADRTVRAATCRCPYPASPCAIR